MSITEAEFRASILPFTLHAEGGLSRDRIDAGNWTSGKVGKGRFLGTKYGISAAAYPWLDIPDLTVAQATAIYWRDYCLRPGFDALPLGMLQVVFDAGVNCGTARAHEWLLAVDHVADERARIAAYSAENLAYHKGLKTWRRYGAVWGSRIAACQKRALTLAAAAPVAIKAPVHAPQPGTAPAAPKAETQPPAGLLDIILRALTALLAPIDQQPQGSST